MCIKVKPFTSFSAILGHSFVMLCLDLLINLIKTIFLLSRDNVTLKKRKRAAFDLRALKEDVELQELYTVAPKNRFSAHCEKR